MKITSLVSAPVVAALAVLLLAAPLSHADLDTERSMVDGNGRTLTVQQWETTIDPMDAQDRNLLTREWLHSGRVRYTVTGPAAEKFEGKLELGYEVGYPWSLSVGINFDYTSPNVFVHNGDLSPEGFSPLARVITPDLLPGVSVSADVSSGPGIHEVTVLSVDVSGPHGDVGVTDGHGTLTGAAGGVLLRPYARLVSKAGDTVCAYGRLWNLN
jgi:MspA